MKEKEIDTTTMLTILNGDQFAIKNNNAVVLAMVLYIVESGRIESGGK